MLRLTPNQSGWAGSAWYNSQQVVSGPFSTTFTFQLTGANDGTLCGDVPCPGDGIAFVIQNSATSAPWALKVAGSDSATASFACRRQVLKRGFRTVWR